MNSEDNNILSEILPEMRDTSFKVRYSDENGVQTVVSTLEESLAPPDYEAIKRDIRASAREGSFKRKKSRAFWDL
jgi:hypothetical protein